MRLVRCGRLQNLQLTESTDRSRIVVRIHVGEPMVCRKATLIGSVGCGLFSGAGRRGFEPGPREFTHKLRDTIADTGFVPDHEIPSELLIGSAVVPAEMKALIVVAQE